MLMEADLDYDCAYSLGVTVFRWNHHRYWNRLLSCISGCHPLPALLLLNFCGAFCPCGLLQMNL